MPSAGGAGALQDKAAEVAFFDQHAEQGGDYDVFTPASTQRLVTRCVELLALPATGTLVDLGCGSGVFSDRLARQTGHQVIGIDLSPKLIGLASQRYPRVRFEVGDAERVALADGCADGVLLSGLLHHLPDPTRCLQEVHRLLKPDGAFVAFDPNRRNPFMYLYRDRTSPWYSPKGVTPNERPVLAHELGPLIERAGFHVSFSAISLDYQYVASRVMRPLLPVYNGLERALFSLPGCAGYRAILLTQGRRRDGAS